MFATPAQFAEIQKGHLDTVYALSHAVFGATERFADLNLAAAKAILEESSETAQSYLGVKDAKQLVTLNASFAQPTLEKFVSYSRNFYSIASSASAEIAKIVEVRIAEGNRKIAEMVDFAAKNAPAGSESAVSLIKNAVAASNTAYDTFSKAAKQAVTVAESNLAAATQATLSATSAASDAVRNATGKKAA
jgi:phasin family protein